MPRKIKCWNCAGSGKIQISAMMERSLDLIKKQGPMTAAKFSDELGLEISNAHHRLKRLVDAGLVKVSGTDRPKTYKAT
jgi:predicted transcriptional regulator